MKLTEQQRAVLRVAEFHFADGVEAIARKLGIKSHIVRYTLAQLEDSGVLSARTLIDEMRLGFYLFHVYFTVRMNEVQKVLAAFSSQSRVTWLAHNSGDHTIAATIISARPEHLFITIENVRSSCRAKFSQIAWAIEGELHHFGSKYLTGDGHLETPAVQRWGGPRLEIDALDARLLRALKMGKATSSSKLAKELGVPASTIAYRRDRLQKGGAILGIQGCINYELIGFQEFEILLRIQHMSNSQYKTFFNWCARHPNITTFIRAFGDWDIKLTVHFESSAQIFEIEDDIADNFSELVHESKIVVRRRIVKSGDFPFEKDLR